MKGGALIPLLEGCGVIERYQTQVSKMFDACTSEVRLSIYDMDFFIERAKKFGWSAYNNEFDRIMEERLNDDVD
jgi:hypothetical protein